MDNQFLTAVAFAGFSGFVIGVVLTWIIAKRVAFQRPDVIREQYGAHGIGALRRLADNQTQQAQTLAEAQRLAQSATAEMTKASELLRQAEAAIRTSTSELSSMTSAGSGRASPLESEPLKPRAARA